MYHLTLNDLNDSDTTRSQRNRKWLYRETYFVVKLEDRNISQSRETIQLNMNTWAEKRKFSLKIAPEKKYDEKKTCQDLEYYDQIRG